MCGKSMCGTIVLCKQDNRLENALCVVTPNQFTSLIKTNELSSVSDQSVKFVPVVDQVEYSSRYDIGSNTTLTGTLVSVVTLLLSRLLQYRTLVSSAIKRLSRVHAYIDSTIKTTTQLQIWYTLIRVATLNMEVIRQHSILARVLGQRTLDSIDNLERMC